MKQVIKSGIFTILVIAVIYFCVMFPESVGEAVSSCVWRCINVIIPSMFIFMCTTTAAVSSGIHNLLSVPFAPLAKYIFRIKKEQFGIFLLSMFSGYPAGIKILTDSCRRGEISKNEFERLSCFCFASGPAFISGVVSGTLFPGTSAGALCFISVTAGNFAAAVLTGFFYDKPEKSFRKAELNISAENITGSVLSSAYAVFQMCVLITAFGGIYRIAELSGAADLLSGLVCVLTRTDSVCVKAVISSFFEISNIVSMPASTGLLPVISALLSFGGICVLIQITVISGGLLNVRKFLVFRLFAAAVSFLTCRFISRFFYLGSVNVFARKTFHSNEDIIPAILLFIMTIMLLSLSKSYRQSEKKVL